MKKSIWGNYLLYCFLCGSILLVSGCDKLGSGGPEKVTGTVISLDEAKKEIVIKDSASGKQRTISVQSADQMAALKPGIEIKARVKHGTAVAEKITPRVQKDSGKKGAEKAGEE
jgi:hypothetical protein